MPQIFRQVVKTPDRPHLVRYLEGAGSRPQLICAVLAVLLDISIFDLHLSTSRTADEAVQGRTAKAKAVAEAEAEARDMNRPLGQPNIASSDQARTFPKKPDNQGR